jgi:hypothetical protein
MSDSEDDSDYNPDEDKKNPNDGKNKETEDSDADSTSKKSTVKEISISRRRKMSEAWKEMNEAYHAEIKAHREKSFIQIPNGSTDRLNKRAIHMLKEIFGSKYYSHITGSKKRARSAVEDDEIENNPVADDAIRAAIRNSVQQLKKQKKIVETRKFAGETIE